MAHPYSERDRAAALAALEANGGNLTRTAAQLGMSTSTLRRWRNQHADPASTGPLKTAAAEALPEARASIADRLREFIHSALDVAGGKLTEANLAQVFTAIGISVEKAQLLEGKPTGIDRHEHERRETPERALEAAADELRRRGLVN